MQASPPDVTETQGDLEYAGQRWHWTMQVTQTQVGNDAAHGRHRARGRSGGRHVRWRALLGFYGTAIGPAGGGLVKWAGSGGAPGTGGTGQDGYGSDDG